jgi:hypothetical protein
MPNSDSLRKTADSLTAQIEAKFNPAIANQNLTARRARIASGMRQDGEKLQSIQNVLYALASHIDAGTLPEPLKYVGSRAVVEDLLIYGRLPAPDGWAKASYARLRKAGIFDEGDFKICKELVTQYADAKRREPTIQDKVRELESELIGCKIPGFFPTPRALAKQLVEYAAIKPGMTVLEPSAGNGHIADAIKEAAPGCKLQVIECSSRLRQILEVKGHFLVAYDFVAFSTSAQYDRVVMNPPFEDGQDIDHVRRAFSLLKPGGRLVAIMGEGAFFRNDKKCVSFRDWLEDFEGESQKLPEGSFTGKDALVQTGVAARVIIVDKPWNQVREINEEKVVYA